MSEATERPWRPSTAARAAGEAAQGRVVNTQGSTVAAGETSQKPIPPAVVEFRNWVKGRHPSVTSGGLGRSPAKPATPGRRRDLHEEGRAIDFMTRDVAGGSALADWLVLHAVELGVQYVIWRRTEWSSSRFGAAWERYTGSSDHADHVHVELSVAAASQTAAEMRARLDAVAAGQPVSPISMGAPLPAARRLVAQVATAPTNSFPWGPTLLVGAGVTALGWVFFGRK